MQSEWVTLTTRAEIQPLSLPGLPTNKTCQIKYIPVHFLIIRKIWPEKETWKGLEMIKWWLIIMCKRVTSKTKKLMLKKYKKQFCQLQHVVESWPARHSHANKHSKVHSLLHSRHIHWSSYIQTRQHLWQGK